MALIKTPLVLHLLCLVLNITASQSFSCDDAEDGSWWEDCPTNIFVFIGCSYNVHALFHAADGKSCMEDYSYSIALNGKGLAVKPKPINDLPPHPVCNLSRIVAIKEKTDHNVTFFASPQNTVTCIHCTDVFDVYDTLASPTNPIVTVLCDEVHVEWDHPKLPDDFSIDGYFVNITDLKSYYTNNTKIVFNLMDAGLTTGKKYNIDIAAKYCKGMTGSILSVPFTVAKRPYLSNEVVYNVSYENTSSYSVVQLLIRVAETECIIAFPTTVLISYLDCEQGESAKNNVSVNADGTMKIKLNLPSNKPCEGYLVFQNEHLENYTLHFSWSNDNCHDATLSRSTSIINVLSVGKVCSIMSSALTLSSSVTACTSSHTSTFPTPHGIQQEKNCDIAAAYYVVVGVVGATVVWICIIVIYCSREKIQEQLKKACSARSVTRATPGGIGGTGELVISSSTDERTEQKYMVDSQSTNNQSEAPGGSRLAMTNPEDEDDNTAKSNDPLCPGGNDQSETTGF